MAWTTQFPANSTVYLAIIPFFGLIFASSWLLITIADEMTDKLATFNNDVKISDESDHEELMQRFRDAIQNYTDAKQ